MGTTRRSVLAAGVAAAATAVVPRILPPQQGQSGTGKFYDKGPVHIYYEEAGSGFLQFFRSAFPRLALAKI